MHPIGRLRRLLQQRSQKCSSFHPLYGATPRRVDAEALEEVKSIPADLRKEMGVTYSTKLGPCEWRTKNDSHGGRAAGVHPMRYLKDL